MVATTSSSQRSFATPFGIKTKAVVTPAVVCAIATLGIAAWTILEPEQGTSEQQIGTAVCLAFSGLSLTASSYKIQKQSLKALSIMFCMVPIGIAALSGITALSFGANSLAFNLLGVLSVPPNTGMAVFVFGVGTIAALLTNNPLARRYISGISGAATSTIGLVAVYGYLTDLPYTYKWAFYAPMTLPSALAVVLLGLGTICVVLRWDQSPRRRTYTSLALGVLVAGLTASGVTGSALYGAQIRSEQQVINILATNVSRYLNRALRTDIRPLETMAAQWREVGRIPEPEWHAQASLMLESMPGLRAVLWVDKGIFGRRVAPKNLPGEWTGRRFDVPLLIEYGERVMAGTQPSLYPVFDGTRGRSFSMMMPVYNGAEQDGFLLTVIDTALWGEAVLSDVSGLSSIIITDSIGIVYDNGLTPLPGGLSAQVTLKVGEEQWRITAMETAELLKGANRGLPQIAVTLGLILTLLLYSSVLTAQTSLKRARALATANAQLGSEVSARQRVQNKLEREIATRRKTESVLTTDRQRLDLALSAGGTGTWRLDPETGNIDVDQQSLQLFGFKPDTFEGTYESFKEVVLAEDLPRIERAVNEALTKGVDFEEDFRILKPDGAVHVIYGKARVIKNQSTKKRMMIGINQDVTERRRAEKLSTLGTLAAGFAHELNNPLMGCVNYVAYARRKTENTRAVDALGKAETEIKRVIRVVQEMLSFSRFKEDLAAQADVNETLNRSISLMTSSYNASGVTIKNDVDPALPLAKISADALEQILLNLLINANHALESSDTKTVVVDADQDRHCIYISVSDTGCGIPDDVGSRLFEPFFTTKKAGKGSGLGLSISLDVIKRFGGNLEFDSTPGVGTTFVITVPKVHPS